MPIIQQSPPDGAFNVEAFALTTVLDSAQTDSLMESIERRVTAIEEAIATGRLADLGDRLRASAEAFAWVGDTFAERRAEAVANAWLCRSRDRRAAS